jgi:hypothetical protein
MLSLLSSHAQTWQLLMYCCAADARAHTHTHTNTHTTHTHTGQSRRHSGGLHYAHSHEGEEGEEEKSEQLGEERRSGSSRGADRGGLDAGIRR